MIGRYDLDEIKIELDRGKRRKIGRTNIRWLFYSDYDDEKAHYWGRNKDNYIVSRQYPRKKHVSW